MNHYKLSFITTAEAIYKRVIVTTNKGQAILIGQAMVGEGVGENEYLESLIGGKNWEEIKRTAAPSNLGIYDAEYTWKRTKDEIIRLTGLAENRLKFIKNGNSPIGLEVI
jgi:hypothetical protein